MTLNLTRVEAAILLEALDTYCVALTEALEQMAEKPEKAKLETKMYILEDISDNIVRACDGG